MNLLNIRTAKHKNLNLSFNSYSLFILHKANSMVLTAPDAIAAMKPYSLYLFSDIFFKEKNTSHKWLRHLNLNWNNIFFAFVWQFMYKYHFIASLRSEKSSSYFILKLLKCIVFSINNKIHIHKILLNHFQAKRIVYYNRWTYKVEFYFNICLGCVCSLSSDGINPTIVFVHWIVGKRK